tara:strand:- start:2652 stop:2843 length:192 start_codon:yes stop_codon:yes gene_type:complete
MKQKNEYKKCLDIISNTLKKDKELISYMSHPCRNYNLQTLEILNQLGIKIGFKETMIIEKIKE